MNATFQYLIEFISKNKMYPSIESLKLYFKLTVLFQAVGLSEYSDGDKYCKFVEQHSKMYRHIS